MSSILFCRTGGELDKIKTPSSRIWRTCARNPRARSFIARRRERTTGKGVVGAVCWTNSKWFRETIFSLTLCKNKNAKNWPQLLFANWCFQCIEEYAGMIFLTLTSSLSTRETLPETQSNQRASNAIKKWNEEYRISVEEGSRAFRPIFGPILFFSPSDLQGPSFGRRAIFTSLHACIYLRVHMSDILYCRSVLLL